MAKKHIHLFETEAQFSNEYTGSGYTEPWVSLTRTVDRVDYNRSPYFGKGLVFDMAQSGESTDFGWQAGAQSFKLIYNDFEPFVLIDPNPYTQAKSYWYGIDMDTCYDWAAEAGSNRTVPVTIINAKALDPTFNDTIDLTMTLDHQIIGGDNYAAYIATLPNNRKIWVLTYGDGAVAPYDTLPIFLFMTPGY